jgi:glycosyltransferase involved in cell wall biosynthesis
MQLAIVHYHLNRGGVTQVIQNHLRALAAAEQGGIERVVILFGGRKEAWPQGGVSGAEGIELRLCPLPELEYDEGRTPAADRLARAVADALIAEGASPDSCVLHIHNHSLGKNVSLPGAITILAGNGWRSLLHVHDFAEDFRPDNYQRLADALAPDCPEELPGQLYPQASRIHYAVLNGRDYRLFEKAGVPANRLHSLPNPVAPFGELPDRGGARAKLADKFGVGEACKFLLYPVRGIRRKNIGEALLWSLLPPGEVRVGITLSPLNPVERRTYQRWAELAAKLNLPSLFGVGDPGGLGFTENLAASDVILTTSVAEGFGMVFLECWLAGRALVGRDLPEITSDFEAAGATFNELNDELLVPIDWVGLDRFRDAVAQTFLSVAASYGVAAMPPADLSAAIDNLVNDGSVDFALLSVALQRQVIERLGGSPANIDVLRRINPWIESSVADVDGLRSEQVGRNAAIVGEHYSLAACGQRLASVYKNVMRAKPSAAIEPLAHGETILHTLLHPSRLNPIRVEA